MAIGKYRWRGFPGTDVGDFSGILVEHDFDQRFGTFHCGSTNFLAAVKRVFLEADL